MPVGLFDNLLDSSAHQQETTISPAEAFAAITLAATASDGYLSESEVQALSLGLSRMKLFRDYSDEAIAKMLDRFLGMLRNDAGENLFEKAKQYLPKDLRETAFAVATDLILADGLVADEEKNFLEQLHRSLEIPDAIALDIVRVILIKNKG